MRLFQAQKTIEMIMDNFFIKKSCVSIFLSVAYIMSVSHLNWRDALRVVRVGRKIANPNAGFQLQLQDFENNRVDEERRRMKERYPSLAGE